MVHIDEARRQVTVRTDLGPDGARKLALLEILTRVGKQVELSIDAIWRVRGEQTVCDFVFSW